jgi:hypothetical protein
MIELTREILDAVASANADPPRFFDPVTNDTFVLLPLAEYERLKAVEYDDSPWTSEERMSLAWAAGSRAGWDDMDEYDDYPEKP